MTIKSLESQITKLDSSAKELKLNLDSTAKEYSKLAATKSGMQKNVVASAAEMDRLFKELEDRDKENRDLMHQLIRYKSTHNNDDDQIFINFHLKKKGLVEMLVELARRRTSRRRKWPRWTGSATSARRRWAIVV